MRCDDGDLGAVRVDGPAFSLLQDGLEGGVEAGQGAVGVVFGIFHLFSCAGVYAVFALSP